MVTTCGLRCKHGGRSDYTVSVAFLLSCFSSVLCFASAAHAVSKSGRRGWKTRFPRQADMPTLQKHPKDAQVFYTPFVCQLFVRILFLQGKGQVLDAKWSSLQGPSLGMFGRPSGQLVKGIKEVSSTSPLGLVLMAFFGGVLFFVCFSGDVHRSGLPSLCKSLQLAQNGQGEAPPRAPAHSGGFEPCEGFGSCETTFCDLAVVVKTNGTPCWG